MGMCVSKAALHVATRDGADGGYCSTKAIGMVSEKDRPELRRRLQEQEQAANVRIQELSAKLGIALPPGMYGTSADRS